MIPPSSVAIRWSWDEAAAPEDAVVWIGSQDEAKALPRPAPDRNDIAEAEQRPAAEREPFLIRRTLLRAWAGRRFDLPPDAVAVRANAAGAPCLVGPPDRGFVSLAHREGLIVVAVAPCPVGVDVERLEGGAEPPWDMLSAAERLVLRDEPEASRGSTFLDLWTAKEAYLKATARGLDAEPASITVSRDGENFTLADRRGPILTHAAGHARFTRKVRRFVAACVVLVN